MKICAAQLAPILGDMPSNLQTHLRLIDQAAAGGAALILFPELSLSGYAPSLARELALEVDDPRLHSFQERADRYGMVILVGLPTRALASENPRISLAVFQPGEPVTRYSKQHLHVDELPYFSPGHQQVIVEVGRHRCGLGICYETMLPEHAEGVRAMGATLYLASVAKSAASVTASHLYYAQLARHHGMPVLMANATGAAEDFANAGQSAGWDDQGHLLAALDDQQEGLVYLDLAL